MNNIKRTINLFYSLPKDLQDMISYYTIPTLEEDLLEIPSFCWFKTRNNLDVEDDVCSECKRYGMGCWDTIMITNGWLIAPLVTLGMSEEQVWQQQFPKSWKRFNSGGYCCTNHLKGVIPF